MPIDLSQSKLAIRSREEGREEGREAGQRDMVRRVLTRRFGDSAIADRVTEIPDALLLEAIDLASTADADDFTTWLDELQC